MWAEDKIYILVGRQFCWLKYFTYHLVPALAPNYKQHILSPAKACFLSVSQLIKMKWHCCHSSYSFHIIMSTKGIVALWASYSFTGSVFHTIFLPAL
jgi:hypothetical protein